MSSNVLPSTTNWLAFANCPSGTRTVSHDGRGNAVAETRPGGVTVAASYDGHAQLTGYSRSNIGAQTYFYNGMGDRVRVVKPTGTRHFVYDSQGRVVAEYGASTSEVKAEFIWALPPAANDNAPFGGDDGIVGYAPLAMVAQNGANQLELYWVHGNHLGVPIVTTNALGQVVDPGNDFLRPGFPGQSQVLSDLYYNRARDYDPVLGRYIQADPIGLLGGANPYLYANGDPVNMVDPLGLMTYWEYYTGLPDSYRRNAINTIAGWSDGFSFGVTWYVRELIGANRDVRLCNDFYSYGGYAGFISLGGVARSIFTRGAARSGLGDLTRREVRRIQREVDRAGRPLDVVGSAARGERHNPGSKLPIGKGPGTKSDIDYITNPQHIPNFRGRQGELPEIDPGTGIVPGAHNPFLGPGIRFEPGSSPRMVPQIPSGQ
jgi:RHS repeat-associated protein